MPPMPCGPLVMFTGCDRSEPIAAAQVEEFLKQLDLAAQKKDPSMLLAHLDKNAVIKVRRNTPMGPDNREYTAKEYREQAPEQLAALKDYKYQRLDTKVEISPDKKTARVTLNLQEFVTLKNMHISISSKQVSLFVRKHGSIIIKSVDSEGTLRFVR
jgi:hypothetical protein